MQLVLWICQHRRRSAAAVAGEHVAPAVSASKGHLRLEQERERHQQELQQPQWYRLDVPSVRQWHPSIARNLFLLAIPHILVRKQLRTAVVAPRSQANCHQLQPLQSQQFGSLLGAGLAFLPPACLPLGFWNAIALELWWLSKLVAAATSSGVVLDLPARARRLRALTRSLRRLSCSDFVSTAVSTRTSR